MCTGKNLVLPVTPKYAKETQPLNLKFEFVMWMNTKMTIVQQKIRKGGDWSKKKKDML